MSFPFPHLRIQPFLVGTGRAKPHRLPSLLRTGWTFFGVFGFPHPFRTGPFAVGIGLMG